MESADRQSSLFARSSLEYSQTKSHGCSILKIHYLIAILLLIGAANSGRSDVTFGNFKGSGPSHWSLANVGPRTNAQVLASGRRLNINIDGFNRQRDIDIAKDSKKLLSLAIALKAELDRNPGEEGSPAAEIDVKAIEKLARDVKDKMQMTPELRPF